jgi:DUF971 family protein
MTGHNVGKSIPFAAYSPIIVMNGAVIQILAYHPVGDYYTVKVVHSDEDKTGIISWGASEMDTIIERYENPAAAD